MATARQLGPPEPAAAELWCRRSLVVTVEGPQGRTTVALEKPYARVGSHHHADVLLDDPAVPRRKLYLHATAEGVYCVDLEDRLSQTDGQTGWLSSQHPLQIGPYRLWVALSGEPGNGDAPSHRPENGDGRVELHAKGTLRATAPELVVTVEGRQLGSRRLSRLLTVVGRHRPSALRVTSHTVSATHCALFWDHGLLWAIDLLSGNGTALDGRPIEAARIDPGSVLKLGRVELSYRVPDPDQVATAGSQEGTTARLTAFDDGSDIGVAEVPPQGSTIGPDDDVSLELPPEEPIAEGPDLETRPPVDTEPFPPLDETPAKPTEPLPTAGDEFAAGQPAEEGVEEDEASPWEIGEALALAARIAAQREEFEKERAAWQQQREQTEAELACRAEQLTESRSELETIRQQLEAELEENQHRRDQWQQQREAADALLREQKAAAERLHAEIDQQRQALQRDRQALLDEQQRLEALQQQERQQAQNRLAEVEAQWQRFRGHQRQREEQAAHAEAELARKTEALARERSDLSTRQDAFQTERQDWQRQRQRLEAESAELTELCNEELRQLDQQRQQLQADRDAFEAQRSQFHRDLETDYARLDDERSQVKQLRQRLEANLVELRALQAAAEQERLDAQSHWKEQIATVESLRRELEAQSDELAQQRTATGDQARELEARQRQQVEALREQSAEIQQQREQLLQQRRQWQAETEQAQNERNEREAEFQRRSDDLETRFSQLDHRKAELDRRAAEAEQQAAALEQRTAEVDRGAAEIEQRAAELDRKAAELDERAAQLQSGAVHLDAGLASPQSTRNAAEDHHRQTQAELDERRSQLEIEAARLDSLEQSLGKEREELQRQKEELRSVRQQQDQQARQAGGPLVSEGGQASPAADAKSPPQPRPLPSWADPAALQPRAFTPAPPRSMSLGVMLGGVLFSGLAAVVAWYAQTPDYRAVARLRLEADPETRSASPSDVGTASSQARAVQWLESQIKSSTVIEPAMARSEVAELPIAKDPMALRNWLLRGLSVAAGDQPDSIRVELIGPGREESEIALNALVGTFLALVDAKRHQLVRELDNLTSDEQSQRDLVDEKQRSLREIREKTAEADDLVSESNPPLGSDAAGGASIAKARDELNQLAVERQKLQSEIRQKQQERDDPARLKIPSDDLDAELAADESASQQLETLHRLEGQLSGLESAAREGYAKDKKADLQRQIDEITDSLVAKREQIARQYAQQQREAIDREIADRQAKDDGLAGRESSLEQAVKQGQEALQPKPVVQTSPQIARLEEELRGLEEDLRETQRQAYRAHHELDGVPRISLAEAASAAPVKTPAQRLPLALAAAACALLLSAALWALNNRRPRVHPWRQHPAY